MSLTVTKGVDEILDYGIDWSQWLGTDTITGSSWTVPSSLVKNSDTSNSTATVVWIAGGKPKSTYEVVNLITTAGGRTAERAITINVVAAAHRTD